MNKQEIIDLIEKEKIIVIVRGVEKDKLIPLAEAMYNGGIRLLEITYDANQSPTDEQTAQNIKMLADHFKDKMLIGSGTTVKESQVELTKNAGGKFIISPDTYDAVIKKTCECGLVSIPGAVTPSEIQTAHRCGADFVKIFPSVNLGASYIKAVSAPLSNIKFLAVGGIDETNMNDYLEAGVCGFGIGSNITNKKMIKENNWDEISKLAEKYVSVVKG